MSKKLKLQLTQWGGEDLPFKNIKGIKKFIENNNADDYIIYIFGEKASISDLALKEKIPESKIKIFEHKLSCI